MQLNRKTKKDGNCIKDLYAACMRSAILFFKQNRNALDFLIALDSLFIDVIILSFCFIYIRHGDKLYVPALLLFYSLRGLCFPLAGQWPMPENYLFEYPGFPSLFVPYKKTNDLYFSGHVGMVSAVTYIAWRQRYPNALVLCTITWILTFFVMLFSRAHFTNDIIMGGVAGLLSSRTIETYKYSISHALLKLICHINSVLWAIPEKTIENDEETDRLLKNQTSIHN